MFTLCLLQFVFVDEEVTEDDNYRGDTEGCAVDEIIATNKRISPVPPSPSVDPTADLYYNSADSFRQQESRFRKQSPVGEIRSIHHCPFFTRHLVLDRLFRLVLATILITIATILELIRQVPSHNHHPLIQTEVVLALDLRVLLMLPGCHLVLIGIIL